MLHYFSNYFSGVLCIHVVRYIIPFNYLTKAVYGHTKLLYQFYQMHITPIYSVAVNK